MKLKKIITIIALSLAIFSFTACESKGPAEKTGEKIDEVVEKTTDEAQEVTEAIDEKAEEAGEKVKESTR